MKKDIMRYSHLLLLLECLHQHGMISTEEAVRIKRKLMKKYQAAIWAQHGLFASGPDFDITFGLAHTIEKSAEIYVKVLSMGGGLIRQTITDDDLRAIAHDFGVQLNEEFLD